jgi:hypothetical protein
MRNWVQPSPRLPDQESVDGLLADAVLPTEGALADPTCGVSPPNGSDLVPVEDGHSAPFPACLPSGPDLVAAVLGRVAEVQVPDVDAPLQPAMAGVKHEGVAGVAVPEHPSDARCGVPSSGEVDVWPPGVAGEVNAFVGRGVARRPKLPQNRAPRASLLPVRDGRPYPVGGRVLPAVGHRPLVTRLAHAPGHFAATSAPSGPVPDSALVPLCSAANVAVRDAVLSRQQLAGSWLPPVAAAVPLADLGDVVDVEESLGSGSLDAGAGTRMIGHVGPLARSGHAPGRCPPSPGSRIDSGMDVRQFGRT